MYPTIIVMIKMIIIITRCKPYFALLRNRLSSEHWLSRSRIWDMIILKQNLKSLTNQYKLHKKAHDSIIHIRAYTMNIPLTKSGTKSIIILATYT